MHSNTTQIFPLWQCYQAIIPTSAHRTHPQNCERCSQIVHVHAGVSFVSLSLASFYLTSCRAPPSSPRVHARIIYSLADSHGNLSYIKTRVTVSTGVRGPNAQLSCCLEKLPFGYKAQLWVSKALSMVWYLFLDTSISILWVPHFHLFLFSRSPSHCFYACTLYVSLRTLLL